MLNMNITDLGIIGENSSATNSLDSSISRIYNKTANNRFKNDTALGKYLKEIMFEGAEIKARTIFEKLSLDLGCNGKFISKNKLDSYLLDVESDQKIIPDFVFDALSIIKENWDKISDDGTDNITYVEVRSAGYNTTLLSMLSEKKSNNAYISVESESSVAMCCQKAYSAAINNVNINDSTSYLAARLSNLINATSAENYDKNADVIDLLTNLIARYSNATSTIEVKI